MSEYWVSKKRYFCKYCEIYIADDAPSRQHHENGLRHKGNVERFIRGIYKTGEKRKKDQEEEKREMARVEQAAQAAFAQDLSLGHAKASSALVASSSSTASRKPAARPSNPFANYSTAAQLGYTDPDMERMQIRKSQGLVGEWQIVEPMHTQPQTDDEETSAVECTHGTSTVSAAESNSKRAAELYPDGDGRTFKLRKKTATVGLGDIYDPGVIPIKLEKKEETTTTEVPLTTAPILSSSKTELPKWTTISLKGKDSSVSSSSSDPKTEGSGAQSSQSITEKAQSQSSRWAKVLWAQPIKEEEIVVAPVEQPSQNAPVSGLADRETVIKSEEDPPSTTKAEADVSGTLNEPEQPTTGLFKKRKAPAGAGRGRRPM